MDDLDSPILIEISPAEFKELATMIYDQFGINLTEKKVSLVRGRLSKILKKKNLKNFSEYLKLIKQDPTGAHILEMIDKISTNHTYFYRESEHFDFFKDTVLPSLVQENPKGGEIRIWCAGCATGEEAYTLAMLCREFQATIPVQYEFRILATDISLTALNHAVNGIYPEDRVKNLPPQLLKKYFFQPEADFYQVVPELQKMILFKRLNFMSPTFPFQNRFHSIFCRNVMIYFDKETKEELVRKFHKYLLPAHYFFIGHSESLGRDNHDFHYIKPSVYKGIVR